MKETGKQLSLVRKKVIFYLSWAGVQENASHCKELSVVVNMEYGKCGLRVLPWSI